MSLRKEIIKLAHAKPELRKVLLPLIKEGSSKTAVRSMETSLGAAEEAWWQRFGGVLSKWARSEGIPVDATMPYNVASHDSWKFVVRTEPQLLYCKVYYVEGKGYNEGMFLTVRYGEGREEVRDLDVGKHSKQTLLVQRVLGYLRDYWERV